MAKKTKRISASAVADTHMMSNQALVKELLSNGWTMEQLQSEIPVKKDSPYRIRKHPFVVFHRAIQNPCFKDENNGQIGKTGFILPKDNFQGQLNPAKTLKKSATNLTGSNSSMGETNRQIRPHGSNSAADGDFLVVSGVENAVSVSHTLSEITTIQRMRSENNSFILGFDSEFYYDDKKVRHILSWQFAFIQPEYPDKVQQILVFALSEETLPFSLILNYIIEKFGIYHSLSKDSDGKEGFSYFRTHRWLVPASNKNGQIKPKLFTSFEEAKDKCCDASILRELSSITRWKKADTVVVDTPVGREVYYEPQCKGYPIGYLNIYNEADKHAIPVTLVCHTGSADVTTLNYDSQYEKDMMLKLSQIQGGLMTLKPYPMHNPVLSNHKYFYPVTFSVRDTMGFAPAKKKRLEDLGKIINVKKLEIPDPYDKSNMLNYMLQEPVDFSEYAINDSVITLL